MESNALISYKCPNCGAPLKYDIDTQGWSCDFCGSHYTKAELIEKAAEVISKSVSDEMYTTVAEESKQKELFDESEGATVYSCPDCGGRVVTPSNTVATFCAFCHNPTVIADRLKGEQKPDKIIPFKINKENALASFKEILKGKPFLPKEFHNVIDKGEISGLYAPFWLFSSDIEFDLDAEGIQLTTWVMGDRRYTKRDSYIIKRQGKVPAKLVPVDASQRLDDNIMDAIEPFEYKELTNFSMEYLSGMFAESYDIQQSQSEVRFKERTKEAVKSLVFSTNRPYSQTITRNFHLTFGAYDIEYAMFPVWTLALKYEGKTYSFAINGQTGKSAGRLPVSPGKIVLMFLGIGLGISLIAFLVSLIMVMVGL